MDGKSDFNEVLQQSIIGSVMQGERIEGKRDATSFKNFKTYMQ